jgi:hypothetical protein
MVPVLVVEAVTVAMAVEVLEVAGVAALVFMEPM